MFFKRLGFQGNYKNRNISKRSTWKNRARTSFHYIEKAAQKFMRKFICNSIPPPQKKKKKHVAAAVFDRHQCRSIPLCPKISKTIGAVCDNSEDKKRFCDTLSKKYWIHQQERKYQPNFCPVQKLPQPWSNPYYSYA